MASHPLHTRPSRARGGCGAARVGDRAASRSRTKSPNARAVALRRVHFDDGGDRAARPLARIHGLLEPQARQRLLTHAGRADDPRLGQCAGMSPSSGLSPMRHRSEAIDDLPGTRGVNVLKSAWMRDPRFDFPVLSVGCLVTAGLSVGLATALLEVSRTTTGPNVGPTAATLNDAFNTLAGAAL